MSFSMRNNLKKILLLLFCGVFFTFLISSSCAKPTLAFTLPPSLTSLPAFSTYTQSFSGRKQSDLMKTYSGVRQRNDSLLMIYHHDQTIAITELGPEKLLLGCELIEIYNDMDGVKLLKRLSKINKPLEIGFKDIIKLMQQCEIVDKQNEAAAKPYRLNVQDTMKSQSGGGLFPQNPLSLFSGIIPGTKWCGTGDIAASFSDLGTESTMDRCCRAHDLCPVKVRAYQTRYKLNNNSLYTKSHCACDDMLYSCLKKTNTSAAQVMGSIYFNLVQVPCVKESANGMVFRKAREGF